MTSAGTGPRPRRLAGLAALMLFAYAIPNAAAQSLIVAAYGNRVLPYVWLVVALITAPTVAWVNGTTGRVAVRQVFARAAALAAASLAVLLVLLELGVPGMPFLIYVWKDVYVVVLVELFWTCANVAFAFARARAAYGWFCAAGSVGSIAGSMALGPLSHAIGTVGALWTTVPLQVAVAWGAAALPEAPRAADAPATHLRHSLQVVAKSRPLVLLMFMVCVVQVAITLMDYQFNVVVAAAYPGMDARTAVLGRVNAVINGGSLVLQMASGAVIGAVGLTPVLLGMPTLVAGCLLGFLWSPGLVTVACVKVAGKCLDYSLFRTAKELLYLPLSYAEKTQGKAVVDMLAYRVAKGGASALLLGLAGISATGGLTCVNLLLCALWLGLGYSLVHGRRGSGPASP